mmetsp:Transcript_77195/g.153068  ORF Transcript_77195/g.153068 Transcript_77195/m.153068 type:complete len:734 (+) Transcript_77195:50-2251(+)
MAEVPEEVATGGIASVRNDHGADAWESTIQPALEELLSNVGTPAITHEQFTFCVDRSSGAPLGISISRTSDNPESATVCALKEGLAKAQCNADPNRALRPGDRIVLVNGQALPFEKLVQALRQPQFLELSIMRSSSGHPPAERTIEASAVQTGAVPSMELSMPVQPVQRPPLHQQPIGVRPRASNGRMRPRRWYGSRPGPPRLHPGRPVSRGGGRPCAPTLSSFGRVGNPELAGLAELQQGEKCSLCLGAMGPEAPGTLSLRRCGHKVHAQCLTGARYGPDGYPICLLCNLRATQQQLPRAGFTGRFGRGRGRPFWRHRRLSPRGRKRPKRQGARSPRSRSRSALPPKCGRPVHGTRDRSNSSCSALSSCGSSEATHSKGLRRAARGASLWCSCCRQHMGWVEISSATKQSQVSKDVRCKKCEDKAQAAKKAEEEEEDAVAFEVDECGLQIAIQQVREAESPEDAKAVLEALLRSRPTSELLETGMWVEAAEGLMTVLDGQLRNLTDQLLRLWGSRCSKTGGTNLSDVPVSESKAAMALASSGVSGSVAMGSDPAATALDSVPVSAALSSVASMSTADESSDVAPNKVAATKKFLGPLLERARRRVKRNRHSPDKAAALIDNPHAEKKSSGNTEAFAEVMTWPRPASQVASVCVAPPAPSNVPRRPPHHGGQATPHWTSISWSGSPPMWCPPPPPPQPHLWSQPRFFLPSWPPPWRPHAQAPGVAWPRHVLPH